MHVFEVSADRQPSFHLAIELSKEGLACCAERMGSPLRWNEEYALAKLSLLAAMDGADKPTDLLEVVRPSSENLLMFMAELNLG